VHIAHGIYFYYTKAILMRREHRNNVPTIIAVGRHHTEWVLQVIKLTTKELNNTQLITFFTNLLF